MKFIEKVKQMDSAELAKAVWEMCSEKSCDYCKYSEGAYCNAHKAGRRKLDCCIEAVQTMLESEVEEEN